MGDRTDLGLATPGLVAYQFDRPLTDEESESQRRLHEAAGDCAAYREACRALGGYEVAAPRPAPSPARPRRGEAPSCGS